MYATVGAVACYKMKRIKDVNEDGEDNSSWEFTQWWVKGYPVQTGSLHWSALEDILYIGFDDGKVQRLKITENGYATEVRFLCLIYHSSLKCQVNDLELLACLRSPN